MNGLGLLITIGFCTIIWWGTRSYYKAILTRANKAHKETVMQLLEDRSYNKK